MRWKERVNLRLSVSHALPALALARRAASVLRMPTRPAPQATSDRPRLFVVGCVSIDNREVTTTPATGSITWTIDQLGCSSSTSVTFGTPEMAPHTGVER